MLGSGKLRQSGLVLCERPVLLILPLWDPPYSSCDCSAMPHFRTAEGLSGTPSVWQPSLSGGEAGPRTKIWVAGSVGAYGSLATGSHP